MSGEKEKPDPVKKKFDSVLVIDDHKMVVIGIKLLIVDQFNAFYQAGNGAAGIELALTHQPTLLIVDNILPDMPGDMVTKEVRARCPQTRILGYSFNVSSESVLKMVEAGIHGYVDKSEDDVEFSKAVNALLEGKGYFSREARHYISNRPPFGEDDAELMASTGFSAKEIGVIRLLCQQKNIQEISRQMRLPEKTVEQYLARISGRTHAATTADTIRFALTLGIIGLDDL